MVDVLPGKDVRDLPDAVHLAAGISHERQIVWPLRLEREVVPVRRALVVPWLADERARDHATGGVLSREDLAGNSRRVIELRERNGLLVRGDLEHRVRGRVDDPLARALMLLAELLHDARPRGGVVP